MRKIRRNWRGANLREEYVDRIKALDPDRSVTSFVNAAVREKLEREEVGSKA
jgi:hypothetical protein